MRVLLFGGTRFLGRYLVEAARARGHEVTLFHRGLSDPDAFPDVEHLRGDRDADLGLLRGRTWDIVFDTSGYEVKPVRDAVLAVAHARLHYTFVSSVSVYSDYTKPSDESAAVKSPNDAGDLLTLDNYGALKVACERAAEAALPGQLQSIRAGIILGPHDYDGRFAYWLRRVARGGEVLAPGNPEADVQLVDVRDLSAWMVRSAEDRRTGIFNATGPGEPLTMRVLLETLRQVTGSDARFTWVSDAFLTENKVAPYSEMPFWLPPPFDGFRADVGRAIASGLTYRPVVETFQDTWAWLQTGWEAAASARAHRRLEVPAGISAERERDLLRAWHASAT
jgi:2'-hydroxyisoflavone reductase